MKVNSESEVAVGRNVNWCDHYGKQYLKTTNRTTIRSRNSVPGYISKENENTFSLDIIWKDIWTPMFIVYNCQDMEAS